MKLDEKILPNTGGFFFGPIEYDDYYFEKLKRTARKLSEIVENKNFEENHVYYWSKL